MGVWVWDCFTQRRLHPHVHMSGTGAGRTERQGQQSGAPTSGLSLWLGFLTALGWSEFSPRGPGSRCINLTRQKLLPFVISSGNHIEVTSIILYWSMDQKPCLNSRG